MVNISEIEKMEQDLKVILIHKLKEYVKENGEDITQYERNVFGLDEEKEVGLTKVLDLWKDGCWFTTGSKILSEININTSISELKEQLEVSFTHWAFQCLYVVIDENHVEQLKYYTFYNNGVDFSEGLAEPDHDYVYTLPLEVIENIIRVISYHKMKENGKDY